MYLLIILCSLLSAVGVNVFPQVNPIPVNFGNDSDYRMSITIEKSQDGMYSGNLQFQLSLMNTGAGAVFFTQQDAVVTITDIDGKC